MSSTSQPEFCGHCLNCGGALYVGLYHGCPTNVNTRVQFMPRFNGDQPISIRESDPEHGGSLIPQQYSNAA